MMSYEYLSQENKSSSGVENQSKNQPVGINCSLLKICDE